MGPQDLTSPRPRREVVALCLVGLLLLGCAWSPLLGGERSLFVYPDAAEQVYPWWQFSVAEIQAGHLPLWDPYDGGGHSHVGEGQTAVFYPPFLVWAVLGGAWAATEGSITAF